jgi:hypothetical protein
LFWWVRWYDVLVAESVYIGEFAVGCLSELFLWFELVICRVVVKVDEWG